MQRRAPAPEGKEFRGTERTLQEAFGPEAAGLRVEVVALVHRLDAAHHHLARLEPVGSQPQGLLHPPGEEQHRHRMDAQGLLADRREARQPGDALRIAVSLQARQFGPQGRLHLRQAVDPERAQVRAVAVVSWPANRRVSSCRRR